MPGKLIHDNNVFWLIESTGDMLNKETESLLVLLCCHQGQLEATKRHAQTARKYSSLNFPSFVNAKYNPGNLRRK